jgi:hypothetical protein
VRYRRPTDSVVILPDSRRHLRHLTLPLSRDDRPISSRPEETELVTIPATEVRQEEVGSLSVRYTGGVPELAERSSSGAFWLRTGRAMR